MFQTNYQLPKHMQNAATILQSLSTHPFNYRVVEQYQRKSISIHAHTGILRLQYYIVKPRLITFLTHVGQCFDRQNTNPSQPSVM